MKTQLLGSSGIEVSRLAYGCMRLSGSWDRSAVDGVAIQRGINAIETAVEAGYTFFDHADVYGDTTCEAIFGQALAQHPGWREQLVVATKCGVIFANQPGARLPHRYDLSARHIIASAEASLSRLQLDRIDLFILHRPDYLADPTEIARAFSELRDAGKVREFGVSNFRPSLVSAVQSALDFPLQTHQVEIHPLRLGAFTDGTLDQCLERQMTPMAWSPLGGGKIGSGHPPDPEAANHARHAALLQTLDEIATELGTERTVVALGWLLRHPSGIVPIVGSAQPEHIRIAARATEIEIDRPSWYRILASAQGERLP